MPSTRRVATLLAAALLPAAGVIAEVSSTRTRRRPP
jgi:hypothetical protein